MLEEPRRTGQYAVPEVWAGTCWWSGLVWDLCTYSLKGKKENEKASSKKLRNYIQIYSTKIMHL